MEHIFKEHEKRKPELLNGCWDFCPDRDGVGKTEEWFVHFPEQHKSINVPGCWNMELDLFDYFGTAWYRKEFTSDASCLLIEFGAVTGFAEVYLDGELLGTHYGGWTAFSFTKTVAAGKHSLVVAVDASTNNRNTIPLRETDWYHYGGITRSVQITGFTAPFIEGHRISYEMDEALSTAALHISFGIRSVGERQKVGVRVYLGDTAVYETTVDLSEQASVEIEGIRAENIRLWDVGKPELYTVRIEIDDDDVIEQIGFRKIEIKGETFLLNRKPIEFRGVNRHEEHPDWGFAMPPNLQKRDLAIIEDLGCNIIRGSHYPNSQTFLDYLDREGVLFWSEIPMWGFTPAALSDPLTLERGLTMHREMIDQYFHHPSIVIWGLHNEIYTDTQEAYKLTKAFSKFVRERDGSRLITFATCRFEKDICLEFADFYALNYYMGWYNGTLDDWKGFLDSIPDSIRARGIGRKPVVISEFGCAALYANSSFSSDKWTVQYQSKMLGRIIRLAQDNPHIGGTFVWQFADVRSDININRARCFNNKGILDEYRRPKMSYYTVKKLYTKQ